MVLRLNYKTCKNLIYIQIIIVLSVFFLISVFHLPSFLSYVTDIINILLLFCIFKIKGTKLDQVGGRYIRISIGAFCISVVIGIIINIVPPLLILWGARNLFRGIIFIIACVRFLDEEDVDKIFKIFFFAQLINLLVTLYQYLVLGINQDYLGGIFGIEQGCNGATNIFCVILLTYFGVNYINKKMPIHLFAIIAISTLIIAALAEIKIYYIEFALIIVLVILFSKPSFRTFFVVGITIAGLFTWFLNICCKDNIFSFGDSYYFEKKQIDGSNPKILLLRAASKNVKAKGSDGIVSGEILKDLGCVNIADSDSSLLDDLSLEAIVKEDPDFIFVIIQGTNTEAALKNVDTLLKSNPVWKSLTAVKNDRYYVLDKSLYNFKPNERWGEAYQKLADILY